MNSRLIVVSNRLPVSITEQDGSVCVERSSGGLVTALQPVMNKSGGAWIGWPGSEVSAEVLHALNRNGDGNYRLIPVSLSREEVAEYYSGCSNATLWPLFHGFPSRCRFEPSFWETYQQVNEHFADAVRAIATPRDLVWVHDYHLMTVASALRDSECRLKLGYFHHIPFPEPETFGKLPWRKEILQSLLHFNVVGFQTIHDRRNFLASVKRYLPKGVVLRRIGSSFLVSAAGTHTVVGAFPISVDFDQFDECSPEDMNQVRDLRRQLPAQKIFLGVDRLDYTKGIIERLSAFEVMLKQQPEFRGLVHFIQVVVPSREEVKSYSDLREKIERCVSRIDGEFGKVGWVPITYLHRQLSPAELRSFYRAADVAVVTPLRDGMNLVAKEFCASRDDERGVLILSEFAGAADELSLGALLTNPYDVVQTAEVMKLALKMPEGECMRRMRSMREQVKTHDVWRWSSAFRKTCADSAPLHLFEPALRDLAIRSELQLSAD
ncbi:MAG TPA: trehalose-6-phosphate synthase [Terriglobales bacterium]|nr:trehalose-6-phosphate synthase [Terriglobales bacterium]